MSGSLGSRLGQLIADLNMNQREFASALACSPTFISEIVRDIKKPGAEFLAKISTIFDVSLDWLVCGRDVNATTGKIKIKVDFERFRIIALRVELAVFASRGNPEAQKMLNELLRGQFNDESSVSRELLKSHLRARIEEHRLIMEIYNENSESFDLNALSEKTLQAALARFGLNNQDALECFVNS